MEQIDNDGYLLTRELCPVCKSSNYAELFSCCYLDHPIKDYLTNFYSPQGRIELEYLENAKYVLDECHTCGLIYQRHVPNDELMVRLYDKWIDSRIALDDTAIHALEYYKELERNIEMAIRHFGKIPSDLSLLDFGMGWGEWCIMARAYGCSVFGMELSQARIDHATKLGIPVLNLQELAGYRFDLINANQVFEHVPKPLETLKSLANQVVDNGIIKIDVPNGWDIKRRLKINDWSATKGSMNSLNPVAPLEHINCFNEQSLVFMARLAGLEPIETRANRLWDKDLLYISVRDIIEPPYRLFTNFIRKGSTSRFFQKSN